MEIRVIGLSLPEKVKKSLTRMSYGLPETGWYDQQDLQLQLCTLEIPDSSYDVDIVGALNTLSFPTQALTIYKSDVVLTKSGKGHILLSIKEKKFLEKMHSSLESALKIPSIKLKKAHENFTIPLGSFDKLDDKRLANWLEANSFLPELEFFSEYLLYMKPQTTEKNKFYILLKKFALHTV